MVNKAFLVKVFLLNIGLATWEKVVDNVTMDQRHNYNILDALKFGVFQGRFLPFDVLVQSISWLKDKKISEKIFNKNFRPTINDSVL